MKFFSTLKKHWLAIGLWLFLILPVGSFLLASAAIAAHIYWPRDFDAIDLSVTTDSQHSALVVHGVKDDPHTWAEALARVYEDVYGSEHTVRAVVLDWSHYAQSSLTCAINGKRIGNKLGRELAANKSLTSVHLIGHSCGAFVVYGACQAIRQAREDLVVQTTYLDPVSVYGLRWNYGVHHFGDCADYSEAYIHTEDDVPGSNQLLPNTHTYDVTRLSKDQDGKTTPHLWPTFYYHGLVESGNMPQYWQDITLAERKPAGKLERL